MQSSLALGIISVSAKATKDWVWRSQCEYLSVSDLSTQDFEYIELWKTVSHYHLSTNRYPPAAAKTVPL